ncbi:hypothetical protein MPER_05242, partial [Moniliophthora perniciosa FA553]
PVPKAEEVPFFYLHGYKGSANSSSWVQVYTGIGQRLRDAQLNKSLNTLRHSLLVKQRLLYYKKVNARHQGATTRSRNLVNRQQWKVDVSASTYRAAWKAMRGLLDNTSEMVWRKLDQSDIRCMDDPDEALKKKRRAAKHMRAAAKRREDNGEDSVPGAGESKRLISWIWEAAGDFVLNTVKPMLVFEGGVKRFSLFKKKCEGVL